MTRQAIIEHTVEMINQLPHQKVSEIADFADFIIKKYEEQLLTENIQQLVIESSAFSFLHDEKDLYSVADLKERHNG
jgi:hypothetical protein